MKTGAVVTLGLIGVVVVLAYQNKDDLQSYVDDNFPSISDFVDDLFLGIDTIEESILSGVDTIKVSLSSEVSDMKSLFSDLYAKWGSITGLDPALIQAVALTESDEDPLAIGDGGKSYGLMQVQNAVGSMYANATGEALLDPDTNIQAGSKFLAELVNKYGIEGGIQAFNLGETKYRAGLTSPVYLSKVKTTYNTLKGA